jgi:8-amino-7-oxononanoate synthase
MTWMDDDLNDRRERGLYRIRRPLQSAQSANVRLQGQELINFASNDYLNLASDPRLARAASRAARRYGTGAGASPLVTGHLPPLRALERALADWEGTEAALVFSSGFVANLAVVSTLAGPEDVIFSDALNHASLIDGCRLSRAAVHVFRHADVNHLEDLLRHDAARARRRLIVTDTIFSMDGDFAPLPDLVDLAKRFDCLLVVDEAHATGVLGEHGRGLTELLLQIPNNVQIIKVGTLSKALGSQGGFVCGSRTLIDWLVNISRPYIFSTALASPSAAAARKAVGFVRQESERRHHVLGLAEFLRRQLSCLGLPETGSQCQIVPIVVGKATDAVNLSTTLKRRGFLVPAIRPPSVPEGTSRLRISLSAGHTEEDVSRLVAALRDSMAKRTI